VVLEGGRGDRRWCGFRLGDFAREDDGCLKRKFMGR